MSGVQITRQLPRVGGDRPILHTEVRLAIVAYGSPAWAGIDPLTPAARLGDDRSWLPRVGGDRPIGLPRVGGDRPAILRQCDPGGRAGSPAWAGIDPGTILANEVRAHEAPPRGRG